MLTRNEIELKLELEKQIENHPQTYTDGQSCEHPGCCNHVTHPCEGCGRFACKEVSNENNMPVSTM